MIHSRLHSIIQLDNLITLDIDDMQADLYLDTIKEFVYNLTQDNIRVREVSICNTTRHSIPNSVATTRLSKTLTVYASGKDVILSVSFSSTTHLMHYIEGYLAKTKLRDLVYNHKSNDDEAKYIMRRVRESKQ